MTNISRPARPLTPLTAVAFAGEVVVAPVSAFERLSPAAGWLWPLAIIAAATVLVQLAAVPPTIAVLKRVAAAAVDDEILAGVERWLTGVAFVRAAWVGLKAALVCWILWLSLALKDETADTRHLMVVAVFASIALVAEDASRVALLWLKGVDQIRGPQDLQSYLGLDAFIDTDGRGVVTKMLLSQISLFSVWFVSLIRGGLISLAGVRPRTATIAGLLCWTYLLALQIGAAIVTASIQHMTGTQRL